MSPLMISQSTDTSQGRLSRHRCTAPRSPATRESSPCLGLATSCRTPSLSPSPMWTAPPRSAGSTSAHGSSGGARGPAASSSLAPPRPRCACCGTSAARDSARAFPSRGRGYYVVVEAAGEVVLVVGDMRKDALRRAAPGAPALAEAVPVARREHVFGKRRFAAKARFHDQGAVHDIAIECGGGGEGGDADMEMTIAIDGEEAVQVKHLQWKFRGNQSVTFSRAKVEVYWDVHDWLFSAGMRPALFIFRPIVLSSASAPAGGMVLDGSPPVPTGFCLYLYAWKLE
ncbi:hypothetical protein GUJ93_ZPchr0010g11196 [Zizania palustris]|uniref:Uncharacterized protein n=1 Tax=Zizania palustris TaxID=103762 RepID=A0A8J6BCE2_ZIZPA|nr:hypothetical protein GUJ93_ZPchr0010g11196 [Zizania palustris]